MYGLVRWSTCDAIAVWGKPNHILSATKIVFYWIGLYGNSTQHCSATFEVPYGSAASLPQINTSSEGIKVESVDRNAFHSSYAVAQVVCFFVVYGLDEEQ